MKEKIKKNKQQEANKSVSEELLISVRQALYKLKDYLNNIDFTSEENDDDSKKAVSIITIVEKMGKAVETLQILERKVQSEEQAGSKVRGGAKLSLLENEDI